MQLQSISIRSVPNNNYCMHVWWFHHWYDWTFTRISVKSFMWTLFTSGELWKGVRTKEESTTFASSLKLLDVATTDFKRMKGVLISWAESNRNPMLKLLVCCCWWSSGTPHMHGIPLLCARNFHLSVEPCVVRLSHGCSQPDSPPVRLWCVATLRLLHVVQGYCTSGVQIVSWILAKSGVQCPRW